MGKNLKLLGGMKKKRPSCNLDDGRSLRCPVNFGKRYQLVMSLLIYGVFNFVVPYVAANIINFTWDYINYHNSVIRQQKTL